MVNLNELDKQAPLGAFSTLDAEVLVPEVQKLQPKQIYLEIGVDKGKSLFIARQAAKEGVVVYGIDVKEDPKIPGTKFFQADSRSFSRTWNEGIDVLFIDGDHSYIGCRADIELWYPFMANNGVMLFHDGDTSSPGVVWAVAEFVDTHRGLVKEWIIHKRTDKNTSMMTVKL